MESGRETKKEMWEGMKGKVQIEEKVKNREAKEKENQDYKKKKKE